MIYRRAVQSLGELRHPGLLDVLQFIETDSSLIIITEKVSKLADVPRHDLLGLGMGILQISSACSFLHHEAKLSHSVSLGSVYVTKNGDWHLFVFEKDDSPPPFEPPEDKVSFGSGSLGHPWSRDTWSFGCFIWNVYNQGSGNLNMSLKNIPENMQVVFKKCLAKNPLKRPSPIKLNELLMIFLTVTDRTSLDMTPPDNTEPDSSNLPDHSDTTNTPVAHETPVAPETPVATETPVAPDDPVTSDNPDLDNTSYNYNLGTSETTTTHEKKGFPCPLCHKRYTQKQHLKRHVEEFHKLSLGELLPKKNFKCTLCKKSYGANQGLHRHMVRDHNNTVMSEE